MTQRTLSQEEIDALIEALNAVKNYGDNEAISNDILKSQVVLTQPEIDKLIESLRIAESNGNAPSSVNTDTKVVLTQPEINSLIDALHAIREYDDSKAVSDEIFNDQTVLSQAEIDKLIEVLTKMK